MALSEAEELELLELENKNAKAAPQPGFLERHAQQISSMARPALEAGGMLAGGALAGGAALPLGPAAIPAAAVGTGLGFAGGKAAADLLDRGLGVKPPIASAGEAVKETAKDLTQGAAAATTTLVPGGGMLRESLKGALSGGTMSAVMDATDKGHIEPGGVVVSSILGGVVPLLVPTIRTVARAIKGGGEAAAAHGTTLEHEAIDEFHKDPALLDKYKGTAEAVGEKVKNIQEALVGVINGAGKRLQAARAKIGFQEPFEDAMARVQKEGFQPPNIKQILDDFGTLSKDTIDVVAGKSKGGNLTVAQVEAPAKARLKDLLKLRESVDDLINYPMASADVPKIGKADQGFLKQLRGKINETIEAIPGGPALRKADAQYADARELYDDFQKQIATQGKAEDVVRRILKGGDIGDVIGKKGEILRMLQEVEAKTGQQLVEPAQKELAARSFNTMRKTGMTGVIPEAIGPRGVASLLTAVNQAASAVNATAMPFAAPGTQSVLQAAAAFPARRRQ